MKRDSYKSKTFEFTATPYSFSTFVLDKNKKVTDFKTFDINPAFESKINLKRDQVVGKLMSEWLFKTEKEKKLWIDNFSAIKKGERKEFDDMIEIGADIYSIVAYTPDENLIAVLFYKAVKYKQALIRYKEFEAKMVKELEYSIVRFKFLFDNSPFGVIIYEVKNQGLKASDYIVKDANQKSLEFDNFVYEEIVGKPLSAVRPGVEDFGIISAFAKTFKTGKAMEWPAKIYRDGKLSKWYTNTIYKLPSGEIVAVYNDVTEEKKQQERIEYLTYRDSLTGLYNRYFISEKLKKLKNKGPSVIIMGDITGLKLVNDAFGHAEGDKLIKKVANVLVKECRKDDIIVRWGGDEFLIIMPNSTEEDAEKICDRIRQKVSKAKIMGASISISLGYSKIITKLCEFHEALKEAESWMYKKKLLEKRSFQNSVLTSIQTILYEKSFETEKHCERLSFWCRQIGEKLGFHNGMLDEIDIFAKIHDMGKITIDNRILNKTDKLTAAEWEAIKRHPEAGYRIASTIPGLSSIADYILTHHERWDGKGYPSGLKGCEIPLASRILAVADAYDAMTNDRPYRKAMTKSQAVLELKNNSGTQFDPKIVDAFLNILDN